LLNLLSNALKYTGNHGWVKLEGKQSQTGEQAFYHLICRNSGQGISPDAQNTLFNRFQRDIKHNDIEGTGVGLAIVKELVTQLDGTIEVQSVPNVETSFYITLPLSTLTVKNNSESIEKATSVEMSNLSNNDSTDNTLLQAELALLQSSKQQINNYEDNTKASILIVEDNSDMRLLISQVLEGEFTCITACDGTDGLELATQHVPDIIISDVMMPRMDGFQLCKALIESEATSHIPVVLLTAKDDTENKLTGLEYGAIEYLSKPFDGQELKMRVHNLIRVKKRLQSENKESQVNNQPLGKHVSQIDKRFIERLEEALLSSYSDKSLTVSELANQVAISERQFQRKIQALFGVSPSEYLKLYRLTHAKRLLIDGQSVTMVAEMTGFSSQSFLSKAFKKQYKVSPSQASKPS